MIKDILLSILTWGIVLFLILNLYYRAKKTFLEENDRLGKRVNELIDRLDTVGRKHNDLVSEYNKLIASKQELVDQYNELCHQKNTNSAWKQEDIDTKVPN